MANFLSTDDILLNLVPIGRALHDMTLVIFRRPSLLRCNNWDMLRVARRGHMLPLTEKGELTTCFLALWEASLCTALSLLHTEVEYSPSLGGSHYCM